MSGDKTTIKRDDFLKDVLYILRETFEGAPKGQGSAYLDQGAGVFNTLEKLTAAEVSAEGGKTSVVAHVEHTKFYLDRLVEFIEGRTEKVNWEQSWLITSVNDEEWNILREGMTKSYENVLRCLAKVETWDQENIGEAISIIAHTAYHLGAIRQMVKQFNEHEGSN